MHSTNYLDTLILPAKDCPCDPPRIPDRTGTVAEMTYARLAKSPYSQSSDDLIWDVTVSRKGDAAGTRDDFFSAGKPCLRASPLVKTYGWAIHHNADGHVALLDPNSIETQDLMANPDTKCIFGMRSKR
ncbi:MAG: DUF6157 family protein [Planktomarina sp.]